MKQPVSFARREIKYFALFFIRIYHNLFLIDTVEREQVSASLADEASAKFNKMYAYFYLSQTNMKRVIHFSRYQLLYGNLLCLRRRVRSLCWSKISLAQRPNARRAICFD